MNFIKRMYYRCRIKRRLREVISGVKHSNPLTDPVTIDDLIGNEPDKIVAILLS